MSYHPQRGVVIVSWLFYNFAVCRDAARRAGLSATAELLLLWISYLWVDFDI